MSDRVQNWFTLNEPQCFIGLGHFDGDHAPGLKLGWKDVNQATHNALLAHGKAVGILRKNAKKPAKVGYAPVGVGYIPMTHSATDIEAARIASYTLHTKDEWNLPYYVDPIVLGKYPDEAYEIFKDEMPKINEGDMAIISQPIDFLGLNIYHSEIVESNGKGGFRKMKPKDNASRTQMGWNITPESMYYVPKFCHEKYQLPIVITENGMANLDWASEDGKVHDPQRIDFLGKYIGQLKKAATDGVPIEAYFHWSFLDNYEWAFGYDKRFGLVHVNFESLERKIKNSGYWYKEVILNNAENIPIPTNKPNWV